MRVCGGPVKIEFLKKGSLGDDGIGHYDGFLDLVSVNSGSPDTVQSRVLMHELVHHIGMVNALTCAEDEVINSVLSNGILAFLRENPAVVMELMLEADGPKDRLEMAGNLLAQLGIYFDTVYGAKLKGPRNSVAEAEVAYEDNLRILKQEVPKGA